MYNRKRQAKLSGEKRCEVLKVLEKSNEKRIFNRSSVIYRALAQMLPKTFIQSGRKQSSKAYPKLTG